MAQQDLSLITFYGGWGTYQQMLVDMIAPLTAEQLARPASPHQWTIGMLVQHIVANRVWWFQMWMGEGSSDHAHIAHWDPADTEVESPVPNSAELVAGLESSWRMIADALARWTAADLPEVFSPPSVMSEEERRMYGDLSRRWIIWHVLEHEIHHGGELSLTLGNYGLVGIYGGM